jgi:glucose-6-phosphate 1-dehydrogenase
VLGDSSVPDNLKVHYFIADISKKESLSKLREEIEKKEPDKIEGRIYYLATSHSLFKNIVLGINSCCGRHEKGFTRIIVEKPFGNDIKSSRELNRILRKYFDEEQIYRADHYLAKETVDNIIRLRLSNPLFERVWNSKSIKRIRMTVDEELGVGNRLSYYDGVGAIKDMVQNHLLQTISFVLMEPPRTLDNEEFKRVKVEALKKLRFRNEIITGQYKEYRDEINDTNPESKTETFVELKLHSTAKDGKEQK